MASCHYCGGDHFWMICPRIADITYFESGALAGVKRRDLRELAYLDWLETLSQEQRTAHLFSSFDPNFGIDAAVAASWMGKVTSSGLPRTVAWKLLNAVVERDSLILDYQGMLMAPADWAQERADVALVALEVSEKQREQVRDELLSWGGYDLSQEPEPGI